MQETGQFHKRLGYWSLTAASLGGVIGSGWLFGAMYAAQAAGPESIVSWIIGGLALMLVALVFIELAVSRPESGGLVRWPRYTNGSLVAAIIGWAIWLAYAANAPTEASGIVQYANKYIPGLSAIATAGIIFAYTGFRAAIDLSGEAVNPARDIPRAVITAIIVAILLYVGLELAFTGAIPSHLLASAGWHGINFSSPFAQLALTLNLTWLSILIYADALISPAGSSFVYAANNSRIVYGLARNRFFPSFFATINARYGVPTRALLLNFFIGLLFLLPLKSWHSIIEITGTLGIFTYAAGSVSVMVYRRLNMTERQYQLRGMTWIAPIGFVIASLIIYWAAWDTLDKTIPLLIVGVLLYFVTYFINKNSVQEITGGFWLVIYLIAIFIISFLGSFHGIQLIPAPWDSVVVAIISLVIYYWAIASGVSYMNSTQPVEEADEIEESTSKAS